MIEGRRVLPSDQKPCVLEYNRGGIATQSRRPVVVFAVITSLISVVVLGAEVRNKFTSRICYYPPQTACKQDISTFETALDALYVDVGRYPTTQEGLAALLDAPPGTESRWHGPYLKRLPRDPWGRTYIYYPCLKAPHESYRLVSCGPDGIEGTPDDITNSY